LQVLAILSFDQREHILSQKEIVDNIEKKLNTMAKYGWFDVEEDENKDEVNERKQKEEERKVRFSPLK
jgi:hypothetical protein